MNINKLKSACAVVALSCVFGPIASFAQEMPSPEQMWKMIKKQQEQIERLEKIVGQTEQIAIENKEKVAITEQMVEATVVAMEEGIKNSGGGNASGTSLGGYAELHYNAGDADQVDFHRFVLFLGHEFNDNIRFFSELEVEHSLVGAGKPGEVELEQAFIEIDLTDNTTTSIGLQLIPIGILNETHEPPTFYGVERNNIEKNIIPSTWWEAGVKFSGNFGETLRYDAMVHSGLKTPISDSGKAFNIRSGRQKVAKAAWKNTAYTGRLTWMPVAGVKLGASLQYQSDLTQSSGEPTSATLFSAHADIKHQISTDNEIGFRALYVQWNLNSDEAEYLGKDVQRGWYIEPSFKHTMLNNHAIGIFTRYSMWDISAGNEFESANKQTSFGVNYWPHQNVVLKADYQIDSYANVSNEDNRVSLGMGVQF